MKKLLCLCAALWLLIPLCAAPILAAGEDACVIEDGFSVIHYGGQVYRCMDFKNVEIIDESSVSSLSYSFQNKSEAAKYKYVGISRSEEHPHILFSRFADAYENYYTSYFVEDSRVDAVFDFISNRIGGEFYTSSVYSEDGMLPIDFDIIKDWIASDEYLSLPSVQMEYEDIHKLIRQSSELGLTEHVGDILECYDEAGDPVFYLIYYPDYSSTYFYASGAFSMEGIKQAQFLRLTDEETVSRLSAYYGITQEEEEPEDELDWIVPGDLPEQAAFWIALILFGILPVALMAFSLVWIFVRQPKNPYFTALCVIIFAAAEVAIAYVALALLLG